MKSNEMLTSNKPTDQGPLLFIVAMIAIFGAFVAIVSRLPSQWSHAAFVASMWCALTVALQLFIYPTRRLFLAQTLFFGGGAYIFSILATRFLWTPWFAGLAALGGIALIACLIGLLIDHTAGHVFAIITIALSLIVTNVLTAANDWTGGASGISQIPPFQAFGWQAYSFSDGATAFAILAFIASLLLYRISRSSFGRKVDAARQNEVLTLSWGLDPKPLRLFLLVSAAVFSAACGVIYASVTTAIAPEPFNLWTSFQPIVYIVVAGIATRFSPMLVAFTLSLVLDFFQFGGSWTNVIYGVLLVSVILLAPGGLATQARRFRRRPARRDITSNPTLARPLPADQRATSQAEQG
jgi:branched-chain amino acid transport system permease protein